MSIKVTGLSAGAAPFDDGSYWLLSDFDGATTYTSVKLTLTQAKAIFGNAPTSTDNAIVKFDGVTGQLQDTGLILSDADVMTFPAEGYIIFDSSGTNKTFVGNGTATINFDGGVMELSTDASAYGTGAGQLYLSPVLTGGGTFIGAAPMFWGFTNADYFNGGNAVVPAFALEWDGVTNSGLSIFSADNSSNTITGKALDANVVMIGGNAPVAISGVINGVTGGGVGVTADTDDTFHVSNLNTTIDVLPTDTATIELDTYPISDGAYKTLQAGNTNITLNQTTAYSTINSARWTLEFTQDATTARTLTLGTNFLTPGGVAPVVSATLSATDTLVFETDSAGKHRLVEHRKAYA